MIDSILTSIKKNIGIAEEDTSFDPDVIMHINSVFMILTQLGVGPSEGFFIEDADTTWDEYISEDENLAGVKTYMTAKVRLIFDPPQSSVVMEALKSIINEFEWRLNVEGETPTNRKEV